MCASQFAIFSAIEWLRQKHKIFSIQQNISEVIQIKKFYIRNHKLYNNYNFYLIHARNTHIILTDYHLLKT